MIYSTAASGKGKPASTTTRCIFRFVTGSTLWGLAWLAWKPALDNAQKSSTKSIPEGRLGLFESQCFLAASKRHKDLLLLPKTYTSWNLYIPEGHFGGNLLVMYILLYSLEDAHSPFFSSQSRRGTKRLLIWHQLNLHQHPCSHHQVGDSAALMSR